MVAAVFLMASGAPPLTATSSDPDAGRRIVEDRALSACTLCHAGPFPKPHLQGTVGPNLAGVGSRLTADALRERLIDPRKANPDTVMPAYHVSDGLNRVGATWIGRPILTAQQIEDVVAYLETLVTP